jgi:hypothetical protein
MPDRIVGVRLDGESIDPARMAGKAPPRQGRIAAPVRRRQYRTGLMEASMIERAAAWITLQ